MLNFLRKIKRKNVKTVKTSVNGNISDGDIQAINTDNKAHKPTLTRSMTLRKTVGKFILEEDVAARFNAYAEAAFPNEIGAMVRIVEKDGNFHAVDLKILKQYVTPAYFEFDPQAQAMFLMEIGANPETRDTFEEWNGMVHSHPNMTPFMSGTDVDNLWKIADTGDWGFSLICSAQANSEYNYYNVNYASTVGMDIMIDNVKVHCDEEAGTGDISEEEMAEIKAEVAELCDRHRTHVRNQPSFNETVTENDVKEMKKPTIEKPSIAGSTKKTSPASYMDDIEWENQLWMETDYDFSEPEEWQEDATSLSTTSISLIKKSIEELRSNGLYDDTYDWDDISPETVEDRIQEGQLDEPFVDLISTALAEISVEEEDSETVFWLLEVFGEYADNIERAEYDGYAEYAEQMSLVYPANSKLI